MLSYSGPLWHVAMVESGDEIGLAHTIHDELGFPVFVPAERIRRPIRGRLVDTARPLFTGYVFPGVDPYRQDWQRLLDIDGVVDVLGKPTAANGKDYPSYVPTAWVEAMRRAQDMGEFDRTRKEPMGFKLGETVRVSEGPFSGHNAVIEEFMAKLKSATARKRAKLLVAFMGRMMRFEMDVMALEKV